MGANVFKLPQMGAFLIKSIALSADSCDVERNKKKYQAAKL